MRILLTNDDGIECVFLHAIIRALKSAGHSLYVVAPKTEQSWIGAAKSRHRPVVSAEVDQGFDCPTWTVDGTPSDCVNIALSHLLPDRPDAVVSGINVGLNASLGFILASGTIGGAWEGALHGLPAVALSQDLTFAAFENFKKDGGQPDAEVTKSLENSAAHAARMIPVLVDETAKNNFIVHNLNFPYPCRGDSEVRRTVPARVIVPGLFSPQNDDGTHRFVFKLGEDISGHTLPADAHMTDRAALASGYISHTVLDYKTLGF